jgi:predicted MFS family arabinose efflux permease
MSMIGTAGLAQIPSVLADIMRSFGVGPGPAGLSLSALFAAAAVGSLASGWVINRLGAERVIWMSGLLYAAADLAAYAAPTITWFIVARCVASIGFLGLTNGPPALLIRATSGRRQHAAMTLWSTFVPAGWVIGPLLSAAVAGGENWRLTFLFHAAAVGTLMAIGALAIRAPSAGPDGAPARGGIGFLFRNRQILFVALALGLSAVVGVGINGVVPLYFVRYHGLSAAAAALLLAGGSIVNFFGGLAFLPTATALGLRKATILIVGVGIVGLGAAFAPTEPLGVAIFALVVALLAVGMVTAMLTTRMPSLAHSPLQGGAIAGLMSQSTSIFGLIGGAAYPSLVSNPLMLIALSVIGWLGIAASSSARTAAATPAL